MSTEINEYKPDYAVHPGEYLNEVLESRTIQKNDFARRCGLSAKTISQITNRKVSFSTDVAVQFEKVLGVSAEIWLRMLASYQLHEAREKEHEELSKAATWAQQFPLKDLHKLGIIDRTRDPSKWIGQLLRFFEVSSPEAWEDVYSDKAIAFRKSPSLTASPSAIATWLKLAEAEATAVETGPYNGGNLRKTVERIRSLTLGVPETFYRTLRRLCADCGVAVVFVPELTGTRISGATEWIDSDTAMIALSLQHTSEDHFWCSLFHEIGHILLHGKKQVFIENNSDRSKEAEMEADVFARDCLVSPRHYKSFVADSRFYESDILEFAKRIGISPGVVVGILQHDGHIKYEWHNGLKRRFDFSKIQ
jgi:HTH-type transcriptional regulator / antitoxin HigA